jgi:signal transduction histidine kinase
MFRKKLLILISVGVVLPLLLLTYLQYRSLTELQNKTKGAFKDNLRQGFTLVQQQMKQRLEEVASQTLDPLGSIHLCSPTAADELEKLFADIKRSHPEIQEIFAFEYGGDRQAPNDCSYVYSDKFMKAPQADLAPVQSDILSQFGRAQTFFDGNRKYLFVSRSCPTCPLGMRQGAYLFYRLPNVTTRKLSGFAGVLLTESFISNELLAGSINKTVNAYHGNTASSSDIAFTINDENNQVIYVNAVPKNGYLFESNFDPPFSNWKAAVGLKSSNLDDLARNSFLHSAGATVLVVLFLISGIALILRATNREARLAQAKSNFVANVSHELKTPLALLSLFSEILEGGVENEEKKAEYYKIIRHESLRLNKVIDNILDFSKIEAGKKTYNFAESDMAEVIENVLSSYRYQISNSGFAVQAKIQPDLPAVSIDREAMAQAISNLVDNAIKYSGPLKQLSITTETRGSDLSIQIADRGIGIPRAEQAKVFEKFYRVGNGLVHDVKGSGLGLSLVKHIIEAHNGSISVESEVGKGSRFTILLPLARNGDEVQV